MSTASVTSSVGPLNVQSIVSQLMSVADAPLTDSQNLVSSYQTELSTVGSISSDLSALQTSVTALSSGSFLQAFSATSSDDTTATATSVDGTGGIAGNFQLNISSLAQSRQLVFDENASGSPITSSSAALSGVPSSLTFDVAGTSTTVKLTGTGTNGAVSLSDISNDINNANAGVNASVVEYNGNYSLVVSSTNTGTDNSFSLTSGGTDTGSTSGNTLAGLQQSSTAATESFKAANADLTVNGVDVSSGSNTLTGVIGGATINLQKTGQVNISMTQDTSSITSAVQSFVSAYNQVINDVSSGQSNMNGDFTLQTVEQELQSTLGTPVSGVDPTTSLAYLAQIGITTKSNGTLSLDTTTFDTALSNNASAVANLFGNSSKTGYADRFDSLINNMLGTNGLIPTLQSNINTNITDQTSKQTELQAQLTAMQTSYTQEYSTLNTSLESMESESNNMTALLASS